MNWEKFTHWLKNEMSRHQSPVDAQDIWQAIAPQLNQLPPAKHKNRRTVFWIIGLGILLVGISGLLILQNQATNHTLSQESQSDNHKKQKDSLENEPEITQPEHKNASNSDVQDPQNLTVEKKTPTSLDEKKSLTPEQISGTNKHTRSLLGQKNTPNADFPEKNQPISASHTLSQDSITKKILTLDKPQNQTLPLKGLDLQFVSPSFLNEPALPEKNISRIPNPTQDSIQERKTIALHFLKPQEPRLVFRQPYVHNPEAFYQAPSAQKSTSDSANHQKTIGKKWLVFAGFTGGLSYAQKTMQAKTEAFNDLLRLRKSSESNLETTHLGFQLLLRHRSGWEFRTGAEQTRIVERFDYQNINTEVENILGIKAYRIGLDNDTTAIYGQVPLTRTTSIQKRIYNSYELIDIPLILGYSKNLGKLNIGLQAGLILNLSLQTRGQVLSDSLSIINLQAEQSNLYKPQVGLGYYLGLRFQRPLFRTLEWNISPFVRFYPQDFSLAQNNISQKYRLLGFNFGLLYRF
ncbi:MAG: hypothetical protein NW226_05770 [Microscillaceae bacterium]|nr:hypothetical protein [Microscillaceae bacterium]